MALVEATGKTMECNTPLDGVGRDGAITNTDVVARIRTGTVDRWLPTRCPSIRNSSSSTINLRYRHGGFTAVGPQSDHANQQKSGKIGMSAQEKGNGRTERKGPVHADQKFKSPDSHPEYTLGKTNLDSGCAHAPVRQKAFVCIG